MRLHKKRIWSLVKKSEELNKFFSETNGGFKSTQSEPAGVCWKSENRFDILKDDNDIIDWHILCDNVTPEFVAVIYNHRTKYRREY